METDGAVDVYEPDGSIRQFQPDSRGGYFAQAGDYGTLAALSGGGYTLTELNGDITAYNADGSLDKFRTPTATASRPDTRTA